MGRHLRDALPTGVQETRARLDAWRNTRKRGEPHPAEIWSEAVEWARRFGVNPVCRALGLSFTDLQTRLGQTRHEVMQMPKPAVPTFVELEGTGFHADTPACPVVEVIGPDGARMVMRWPAGSAVDVGTLMASFLARRP
jgi:hypothetical protein